MWRTHHLVVPGRGWDTRAPYKEQAEDAAAAWHIGTSVALAVADGLGTAAKAAQAAALALSLTESLVNEHAPFRTGSARATRDEMGELFARVRASFLATVSEKPDSEQWQTTLTLAILLDRDRLVYASMGDSILAIQHDSLSTTAERRRLELVSYPCRREGHRTETRTLRDELWHAEVRVLHEPGMTGVLMATDGIEGLINAETEDDPFVRLDASLHGVVSAVAQGNAARADDFFERTGPDSVRGEKGDDIGIAVAAWG